jgi:DNA-binding beta-propeller fold protein YncE
MRIVKSAKRSIGVACYVLLATAACGGTDGSPSGTDSRPSTSVTALPKPFEVVATYPAATLGLDNPRWLAVGSDGNFYITDARDRVSVFSPDLKLLRRWGSPGTEPGQFDFINPDPQDPHGVAASLTVGRDGTVVVADSGNYRFQMFTMSGIFAGSFGAFGSGPGKFTEVPGGAAVDDDGYIFVTEDTSEGRLSKYSPSGKLVWTKEPDPRTPGHLHVGDIDARGRLVIVNDDAQTVLFVSREGKRLDGFDLSQPELGCEATSDESGHVFVTGCGPNDSAYVYDRSHKLVGLLPISDVALWTPPVPGPGDDRWALTYDGSLVRLHATDLEG